MANAEPEIAAWSGCGGLYEFHEPKEPHEPNELYELYELYELTIDLKEE